MKDRVSITRGAGSIGSKLARRLLVAGYEVSILGDFSPQIHGSQTEHALDLRDDTQLFRGDVRDAILCEGLSNGANVLVRLAAETWTGQSMYSVRRYIEVNMGGTAKLMELLLKERKHSLRTTGVASSRAVYGEGAAHCAEHGRVFPGYRSSQDLRAGDFEPKCPICRCATSMMSTSEHAQLHPSPLHGLTKQVQEKVIPVCASTRGLNRFALRCQIFEDGKESGAFACVDDVVEATLCAIAAPSPVGVAAAELISSMIAYFSSPSKVVPTGAYRQGDIQHNCANTEKLLPLLRYTPTRSFSDGLRDFFGWTCAQTAEGGMMSIHSLNCALEV